MATQLALNAYMLDHEDKYRDWITEYSDAWVERAAANSGNFPTNVGLDGGIGKILDGKWYRGTYGWNFSYWHWTQRINHENHALWGVWPGMMNALMVTGDQKYIDAARWQMDNLYDQKKIIDNMVMIPKNYGMHIDRDRPRKFDVFNEKDSMLYIPEGSGVEGWYNWTPDLYTSECIDLYLCSMDQSDLDRIRDQDWIRFLEGENPGYPEEAYRSDLRQIREKIRDMRNDPTTPDTRLADWPLRYTPAAVHNLINLMMGGNLTARIWCLHCRVRYFDPEHRRSGIPGDVAGLVTKMDGEVTHLTLVNLNQIEPRSVIIQTGAYGEHQCLWVRIHEKEYPVDSRFFRVFLAPGAGTELVIRADRYANQPNLAFPWHGENIPPVY